MTETIEGIIVHRNFVYATPNEGFYKKTLGHVSFMISSVLLSLYKVPKPDVVIVSSPTLFSVISGYIFSRFRRAPMVFEVRDLWPDTIVKLGVLRNKWIIGILEKLELFLYRRSKLVVTVTEAFKRNIVSRGIDASKVAVITNGVDTELFNKDNIKLHHELLNRLKWTGKKVLLYAGAHGLSQGLTTLLDAAKSMQDYPELLFAFVGQGAEKRKLQQYAAELKLNNVQFIEPLTKEEMPTIYASAYLSFVSLRNIPMFDDYIPSKMFEILGSGCPIVASLSGEAAKILKQSGGAIVTEPENVDGIVAAVKYMLSHPEDRNVKAHQGYEFVKAKYSRELLANRYFDLLHKNK